MHTQEGSTSYAVYVFFALRGYRCPLEGPYFLGSFGTFFMETRYWSIKYGIFMAQLYIDGLPVQPGFSLQNMKPRGATLQRI